MTKKNKNPEITLWCVKGQHDIVVRKSFLKSYIYQNCFVEYKKQNVFYKTKVTCPDHLPIKFK